MPLPAYPPFQQKLIDDQTGLLTQPWVMFFLGLFGSSGGGGGGGSLAPANAEYLVASANAVLTQARVATDTLTIHWDFSTLGFAYANFRDSAAESVVGRAGLTDGVVGDIVAAANNDVLMRVADQVQFMPFDDVLIGQGEWSPLTNGDPVNPELIFDGDGNSIAVFTPL